MRTHTTRSGWPSHSTSRVANSAALPWKGRPSKFGRPAIPRIAKSGLGCSDLTTPSYAPVCDEKRIDFESLPASMLISRRDRQHRCLQIVWLPRLTVHHLPAVKEAVVVTLVAEVVSEGEHVRITF